MIFLDDIDDYLRQKNLPTWRYKQIYRAITGELVTDFSQITTLSKTLRQELARDFPYYFPKLISQLEAKDCQKFLLEFEDGLRVETVLISEPGKERNTVCFSTQFGCPLDCCFCATGQFGFKRNLDYREIAMQVLFVAAYLKQQGRRLTNAVAMGMGEPLLNYDNLLKALRLLNDKEGFNLAARHISVSTSGIIPAIKKIALIPEQFNLALSLHSPFDRQRRRLMPIAKRYELGALLEALGYYIKMTGRKVMLEYLLLNGVNTSLKHLDALAELANSNLFHVNLVNYNLTNSKLKPVSAKEAKKILDYLKSAGVSATLRRSVGGKINAACGQLVGAVKREPRVSPTP